MTDSNTDSPPLGEVHLAFADSHETLRQLLRDKFHMTNREIDIATGVSRWRKRGPSQALASDLASIVTQLSESGMLYPEEIGRYLRHRHEDLRWARPIVLLRRARYTDVQGSVERLIKRMEGR